MTYHASSTTRRAVALLAVAAFLVGGLTGCSPERKGITGLTVDSSGRPFAAVAWCADRPPEVLVLLRNRETASPPPSATPSYPRWKFAVPRTATSPATVPLDGFPPEPAVASDVVFAMYAVADDNSFTTHGVSFRLAEMTDLVPGSVLFTDIVDGEDVQQTVSLEEFAGRGESEC
ncbi:hypothetical protein AB0C06_06280 [Micromonospora inaquosa]|uniref:Uncharacterized protein n=1 Tax=Micromonospora inaquosa TaxID=2203716 RepID=A0A3N9WHE7_9ACTN|nr:hypothetical protein [Micromonospora inaquosa]RQX00332.1 hypothetical protein DLJ59_21810 [Micromonospora inaquosa]